VISACASVTAALGHPKAKKFREYIEKRYPRLFLSSLHLQQPADGDASHDPASRQSMLSKARPRNQTSEPALKSKATQSNI
jgi:hypothetical protein